MKVFISSVRRGLEAERDHLPVLLKVAGYEPVVFEQFTAQTVPSRDAVIAAVENADVAILLLGSIYGEPLSDSGVATTEEEFLVAKRNGTPLLVFRKANINPEPRQQEFISRVGDYVQGRFWKEFNDHAELGVAVIGALKALEKRNAPLSWVPASPVSVTWRADRKALADPPNTIRPSVLEVHLLAVAERRAITVSALESIRSKITRVARDLGFFSESASVTGNTDMNSAWATTLTEDGRRSFATGQVQRGGLSGIAVDRSGSVLAFKPLPRDMIGALVNLQSLTADLANMIRLSAELIPDGIEFVVPAAGIDPLGNTDEGDPSALGRSGGGIRITSGDPLRTEPEDAVDLNAFPEASVEVGKELAARLLTDLRSRSSW